MRPGAFPPPGSPEALLGAPPPLALCPAALPSPPHVSPRLTDRGSLCAVRCRVQRSGDVPRPVHLRHLHPPPRLPAAWHRPGAHQHPALPPLQRPQDGAGPRCHLGQAPGGMPPALRHRHHRPGASTAAGALQPSVSSVDSKCLAVPVAGLVTPRATCLSAWGGAGSQWDGRKELGLGGGTNYRWWPPVLGAPLCPQCPPTPTSPMSPGMSHASPTAPHISPCSPHPPMPSWTLVKLEPSPMSRCITQFWERLSRSLLQLGSQQLQIWMKVKYEGNW